MTPEPFDTPLFRERFQAVLEDFVDEQSVRLLPLGADAAALVAEAHRSVTGGKRFRAAFCYWGFRAAAAPYCVGLPDHPARRCAASNARCVAGRPRRVSEASM